MKYYLEEKQLTKLNYYLLLYSIYYILVSIAYYILIPQVLSIFLIFIPIAVLILYLFLVIEEKVSDKKWQRGFSSEGISTSFKESIPWANFKNVKQTKIFGYNIISFKGNTHFHSINFVRSFYNDSELKYVFKYLIPSEINYKESLMKFFDGVDESEPKYTNLQETPKNFILLRIVMLPLYAFIVVSVGRFLKDYI